MPKKISNENKMLREFFLGFVKERKVITRGYCLVVNAERHLLPLLAICIHGSV